MPGPGGGRRGPGGGRRGGPGGLGGGPRGVRGPVAPPAPGMFFGGPGLGGRGGRPRGPMGTSCCCWVWLCVVAFVVLASVGIALIETLDECTSDSTGQDDEMAQSTCYGYEVALAMSLGILALCCCCCCMRPSVGGYQPIDGTQDERQHMLATEAQPPPRVYGNPSSDPSKLTV